MGVDIKDVVYGGRKNINLNQVKVTDMSPLSRHLTLTLHLTILAGWLRHGSKSGLQSMNLKHQNYFTLEEGMQRLRMTVV